MATNIKNKDGIKLAKDLPFGFYYIDRLFLEEAQAREPNIPNSNYTDYGRHEKFYIGPMFVLTANGYEEQAMFAPVSHSVPDAEKPRSRCTIISAQQCIKHEYSVPVKFADDLTPVSERLKTSSDKKYTARVAQTETLCKRKSQIIKNRANKVHNDLKFDTNILIDISNIQDVVDHQTIRMQKADMRKKGRSRTDVIKEKESVLQTEIINKQMPNIEPNDERSLQS